MSTALLLLLMHPLALGLTETDDSVVAGREALDQWWPSNYPWYDRETDGLRRVDIPQPWDWSWLAAWWDSLWAGWDFSWLWSWWPNWNFGSLSSWPVTFWQWSVRIGLVLAVALLGYLLFRFYRKWQDASEDSRAEGKKPSQEEDVDRIEALPFPVRLGRLDLLGEARMHYEQGNYGQAMIYLFSFQLVRLDRRQIIRLTKGKTNRQYMREVGPRGALRRLVEQTMVAFEDVFFGNHSLDRARFESCWSRLEEFEALSTQ